MLERQLCQKLFQKAFCFVHQSRLKTLLALSVSLLRHGQLTVTNLGRFLPGSAHVKHKIKRADRFLSNALVYAELPKFYQAITKQLLADKPIALIAVDWSGCCCKDFWVLRASLLVEGRSIVLYNQVVPQSQYQSSRIHKQLLTHLAQAISANTRVILVTDAGFHGTWFNQVRALGWDFVGRVRGSVHVKVGKHSWQSTGSIYKQATNRPQYLGPARLGKRGTYLEPLHVHLYQEKAKGRKKKRLSFGGPNNEHKLRKMNTEPWLLVTSLTEQERSSIAIVNDYKKRMQIEQNFRDDKNQRWGYAWRYSRTRHQKRLAVMCLIATLASIMAWFIGFTIERLKLHRRFQANTVKSQRVLSYFFLARLALLHKPKELTMKEIKISLNGFYFHFYPRTEKYVGISQ